jgi:hypothetical protein
MTRSSQKKRPRKWADSIGHHKGNAGKRALALGDFQGPAEIVLGSRPYQVSDHLVSKGARFNIIAQLHRTEVFGLGVAAVRHEAVVGHALYSTLCPSTRLPASEKRGMTRLGQRGAVAFTGAAVAAAVILLITLWEYLLANDLGRASLARMFDQPKLSRLLAHLVLVPAQQARGVGNRVAITPGSLNAQVLTRLDDVKETASARTPPREDC